MIPPDPDVIAVPPDAHATDRAWKWLPARTPALAAHPTRWLIAVLTLTTAGLMGKISALWMSDGSLTIDQRIELLVVDTADGLASGIAHSNASTLDATIGGLARAPEIILGPNSVPSALLLLLIAVVLGVGLVTIGRSAALSARGTGEEPWPVLLAAGVSRAPRGLAWLAAGSAVPVLGFVVIGWLGSLLLGGPQAGAVLFAAAWVVSIPLFALGVLLVAAVPGLLGALACEPTDGLDAFQRSLAYTVARPLRTIWNGAVAIVTGGIAAAFAGWLVHSALDLGLAATGAFVDGRPVGVGQEDPPLGVVRGLASLAVLGYAFSALGTASALVYLKLRLVVDRQSPQDL